MNKKIKAWYFSAPDKKLGYGDGRDIIIGETHTISNRPMCCSCGLHGSIRLCDALYYAKSPYLYRVEIFGKINQKTDKLCGQSRKYLSGGIDITSVLMEFSRWCALQVVHLWDCPPLVLKYLKTGNKRTRAAAARAAANSAAAATADAAARAAARAAGAAAANLTADDYAAAAARTAAHAAAAADYADYAADYAANLTADGFADEYAAALEKQNRKLTQMVMKYFKEQGNET